jgi:hypothetical protein
MNESVLGYEIRKDVLVNPDYPVSQYKIQTEWKLYNDSFSGTMELAHEDANENVIFNQTSNGRWVGSGTNRYVKYIITAIYTAWVPTN